jgi:N-acyl-D-amino-acid deacylase
LYDSNQVPQSVAGLGEINGTFWTAATYRHPSKHFASIAVFATVSLPMKRNFFWLDVFLAIVFTMFAEQPSPSTPEGNLDVIIRNGTVYDGTGAEPRQADIAIRGDRIAGVGDFKSAKANTVIDAKGLAVAPGFINMLSWSTESLIQDGRSQSEIRQGVTTEIMGEGESMGPVNDRVREHKIREQTDIKYDITWNTLTEYLQYLEKRGV